LKIKTRNEVIQRAKDLKYEQKGKARFLRSQQLYTDVIATREQQIIEKAQNEAKLVEEETQWHQQTMQRVNETEKREKMDSLVQKQKARKIGELTSKQNLEKETTMKREIKQQKKEEVVAIRRIAHDDIKEEERQFLDKLTAKRKTKEEMDRLSDDIKKASEARLQKEMEEAMKREEIIAEKTLLVNERAQLERHHFELRQAARKIESGQVAKELSARVAKSAELFIKEKKKQEAKAMERQEREVRERKHMEARIHQSRQEQIQLKEARKVEETKESIMHTELCKAMNLKEQRKEREEEHVRRQKDIDIRKFQEKQICKRHEQRTMERAMKLEGEKEVAKELKREDDVFREFAFREMEQFRVQGKQTNLLQKSMEAGTSLLY